MCGIAGIFALSADASRLADAVTSMTAAQCHRGPDDGDVEVVSSADPVVVLGHRRLSILDLSPAGHQPMCDSATGVTIIHNGEIYNFRELRRDLQAAGHEFRTGTDTEVILRGFLEWKNDLPARLRGIFALALWDPRDRTLLLSRDALGVKPLYFFARDGFVAFASEVRTLLASGLVARKLDLDGVRSYLAFGSVQEPLTLVSGVRSVAAGTSLVVNERGAREQRFYALPLVENGKPAAPREKLRHALTEAVRLQLVADVPLGAFLSGGIDSTAIVVLMNQARAAEVRTFNVCFESEDDVDERRFARKAAEAAGAVHTEIELGQGEFFANLDSALAAYDQPSADGVNTWFVSRAVRSAGLTVALSGVGGDELFVGYNRFAKPRFAERAAAVARLLPPAIRERLGRALERRGHGEATWQAGSLLSSSLAPYFATRRVFGALRADALMAPALRDGGVESWTQLRLQRLTDSVADSDQINRISALELQTYMQSTLLRDTDQMSMAHALEVRVPLIDQDLVDLVLPVAGDEKVSPATPKRLLVEPLSDLIPGECIHRRKRGFTLPFAVWLRSPGGERAIAERFLGHDTARGPLDPGAVARLQWDFRNGTISWSRVWTVFILADWLTRHRVEV